MISEKQIEQLTEILIKNIDKANMIFLENIGSSIKKIGELSSSKAHQLIQILRFGGNFEDMEREIAKLLNTNVETIDKIFSEYAQKDQNFYKKFYQYRDVPFVPYKENEVLQKQVLALAHITKNQMMNYSRSNVIGYSLKGLDGKVKFLGLRETYDRILDEAFLNVGQGKETFDDAMRNIMKQLGGSGLKTVDYSSGRSIRLDSMARMHLMNSLTELHNENQKLFGKEFGADGVEISVHELPAPDHAEVQGRQFSNKEFEKFQNDVDAVDYKGKRFPAEFEGHDRRSIGEFNCYHYIFSIVLEVSKPNYDDKQLQEKINRSKEVIKIDGKDYTRYECTQLQRQYERKIREQKDIQILAKSSGDEQLILESQSNITNLTRKYKEISKKAGLPTKSERLRVSGYKRAKIDLQKYYNDNLVGLESNGFKIDSISKHFTERAIERKILLKDIKDAFTNPLFVDKIKIDKEGRRSVKIIGENATISINSDTNTLTTIYKTGKRIKNKYKR